MSIDRFIDHLDKAYQRLALPQKSIGFTEDDLILFTYRSYVRSNLDKLGFIISPDIASAMDMVIEPGNLARVPVVIPDDFKPFTDFHPYSMACWDATTRSRYAQLGQEVCKGGILHNTVSVRNHADRPFSISAGEKFLYMYYWNGNTLRGTALNDLIGTDSDAKIRITGKEGIHWNRWYGTLSSHGIADLEGIELMIDPNSRRYIPLSDEPMKLHDLPANNHLRGVVDSYLRFPLPQLHKRRLWISESAADLQLDPCVHGIVQWYVDESNHDFQTNSVLFQGGNTYGRIRNEIVSPTTEELIPKSVIVRFVNSGK